MTVKKDGKIKHFLFATATVITVSLVCAAAIVFLSPKAGAETEGIYTYTVSNGEAIIERRISDVSGDITIPDTLGGYPVTVISNMLFSYCTGLTSVNIPDSVTSIDECAFYKCTGLTSVKIGNGVTSIGDCAFSGCAGLTSITIPDSVTSIGGDAFFGCTGLKSVYYTGDIADWCSVDLGNITSNPMYYANTFCINGKTVEGELIIPDGVISIGDYAFENCFGLTSVIVSNSATSIGWYAFYKCTELTSTTIPDCVKSIGGYAFCGCTRLTNVKIPDSVTSIGDCAFSGCAGLTSITIPDGVTSIRNYAFSGCTGLKCLIIPDSVTSILYGAFSGCTGLTSVKIPDSVTSIGGGAFSGCTGLTSVKIPDSVTSIGGGVFLDCTGLTSVKIPDSVKSIGSSAFVGCAGLTSITIPDGVTIIGDYAFSACSGLTSVTIGNGVTSISNYAFEGCDGLTSVRISNSVASIGEHAFYNCDKIEDVYFLGDSSKWNSVEVGEGNQSLINSNIHFLQTIMIDYCGKTESISIFSGEPIEAIEAPSKEGYVFDCWLDENGEKAQIPEIMPAENIVLTAKYNKVQQTNGIFVLYDEEAFGKDIQLKADDETDTLSPEVIAELKVRISGEKNWSKVYTISFIDSSGHTVKFKDGQKVTVSIPIPESANANDKFKIYHVPSVESGKAVETYKDPQIRQENGYLIFDVTHFSYFVLCVDRTPVSIRVASTPNKTSYLYKIDKSLDLSGLAIEVTYDDGSTETVTDTALMNFSGFDSKKTGEQTVTVEYGGLSAGFTVNVKYAWWQWIIKILLLGFLWY
ncbi:MAG: leucine-rich repeat protein [Acutalibacteraceae bacterium]